MEADLASPRKPPATNPSHQTKLAKSLTQTAPTASISQNQAIHHTTRVFEDPSASLKPALETRPPTPNESSHATQRSPKKDPHPRSLMNHRYSQDQQLFPQNNSQRPTCSPNGGCSVSESLYESSSRPTHSIKTPSTTASSHLISSQQPNTHSPFTPSLKKTTALPTAKKG